MTWFDVDGARHYLAQQAGSSVPSRKVIYRMVAQGLRVARAEGRPDAKRGGSRMFFAGEWIDEFLRNRAIDRGAVVPIVDKALGLRHDASPAASADGAGSLEPRGVWRRGARPDITRHGTGTRP